MTPGQTYTLRFYQAASQGRYFTGGLVPGMLLAFPLSVVAFAVRAMVPYRMQPAVVRLGRFGSGS